MDPDTRHQIRTQLSVNLFLDVMKAKARGELRLETEDGQAMTDEQVTDWVFARVDDYLDKLEGWETLDENVKRGITPNALTKRLQPQA